MAWIKLSKEKIKERKVKIENKIKIVIRRKKIDINRKTEKAEITVIGLADIKGKA